MSIVFILFISFLQVGLFSVGGGYAAIPLIQNQVVNVWQLMTIEEFADLITIAEMTPGQFPLTPQHLLECGLLVFQAQLSALSDVF